MRVAALAASTDCTHAGASERSALFTAWARRIAHLVQFGSFVFKHPMWKPYQQPSFFIVGAFVAMTFISNQTTRSDFIRPREAGIVWKSVTGRLCGKA